MIHARKDYSRFQDPALKDPSLLGEGSTPIAEDEPVMLFRAQDENFIAVVQFYRDLIWKKARPVGDLCNAQIERAKQWQKKHGAKTPDVPGE